MKIQISLSANVFAKELAFLKTPDGIKAVGTALKKYRKSFQSNVVDELENWGPGFEDTEIGEIISMAFDENRFDLITDVAVAATKWDLDAHSEDTKPLQEAVYAVIRKTYWNALKSDALVASARLRKRWNKNLGSGDKQARRVF